MLRKKWRLRLNSDFQRIFSLKNSSASKYVVAYVHRGNRQYGFIASKKVGNAVQRNRAKRLMREVIRLHMNELGEDKQIILIARPAIKGISYLEVENSVLSVLRRLGVLRL